MQKPTKKEYAYYPYNECAKYIEHLMGIKDIRDVDGKFYGNEAAEYKDFWHFLLDKKDIHNGCAIQICMEDADGAEDWQREIVELFVKEFGEGAYYWVEW